MITLSNVRQKVKEGGVIVLEPVYEVEKRRWWFIPLPSFKYWKVVKPIEVQLDNGDVITVEEGFITDLCSVPQFLWWLFAPYGPYVLAYIIHDWLYKNNKHKTKLHNYTQSWCDKQMLKWACALHDNRLDNRLRLIGVRLGGKSWWNAKK